VTVHDRLIASRSREILRALATAQQHLAPTTVTALSRRTAIELQRCQDCITLLVKEGLVEGSREREQGFASYALTDAGWREVGEPRPIWT
jgi:DNA-binding IscR family transcriptional regulator